MIQTVNHMMDAHQHVKFKITLYVMELQLLLALGLFILMHSFNQSKNKVAIVSNWL